MTGREQYQATARQALRANAAVVRASNEVVESGDFQLRLQAKNGVDWISLPSVEQIEWSDTSDEGSVNSSPTISGTVTLRQPLENGTSTTLPDIQPNDLFECLLNGYTIWKMRAVQPAYSAADGTVTVELQDEMRQLALSRDKFAFINLRPDQIATKVCDRFGIKHGTFLQMKELSKNGNPTKNSVRVHKLKQNSASPSGVIRTAYSDGQRLSGQRYVMRWNYVLDQLEILAMEPSASLYRFSESTITDAQIEVIPKGTFATSLQVAWRKPMPKNLTRKKKKSWVKEHPYKRIDVVKPENPDVIKRYGNIRITVEMTRDSKAKALADAKNDLAARLTPKKTLTFTTAGVAGVRRGDYIEVHLPKQGFDHRQLWVQSVSHTVSESYTMEVTARFDDPMNGLKIKAEAQAAIRYRAAKKKAAKRHKK